MGFRESEGNAAVSPSLCPGCFLGSWAGLPPFSSHFSPGGSDGGRMHKEEQTREAPSRSPGLGSNVVVFPPPIEPAGALGLFVLLRHPSAVWIPGTRGEGGGKGGA